MFNVNKQTHGPNSLNRVKRRPKQTNFPYGKLLCTLILFAFTNTYAQQRNWIVGKTMLQFSNVPNTQISPNVIHSFSTAIEEPANSVTDAEGNLLFYVRNSGIYSPAHVLVGSVPAPATGTAANVPRHELTIVPFIEEASCNKRFYIFYQQRTLNDICIHALIVNVQLITGQITVNPFTKNNQPVALASKNIVSGYDQCALAVSGVKNGKRYGYFLGGGGVQKFTIEHGNNTDYGLTANGYMSVSGNDLNFVTMQATLSEDGSKLAWGIFNSATVQTWRNAFFVMPLDSLGNSAGTTQGFFVLNNGNGVSIGRCNGVAFNQDGTKLFGTTGTQWDNQNPEGLYVINLATDTQYYLPNTARFGVSQLKLAPNGLIYAADGWYMSGFDPATEQIIDTIPVYSNFTGTDKIHYLPDQVFGEADDKTYFDNPVDSLTLSYKPFHETSGAHVWNPAAFGGKDTIKLTGQNYFTGPGTSLSIEDLVIEFDDDAELYMEDGATLSLTRCTLRGLTVLNCKTGMWKGITATTGVNDQFVFIFAPDTAPVIIRDAITGLYAGGKVNIIGNYAKLTANETGLALFSGAKNASGITFDGSVPLRNQAYGSSNGYSDGLNRTINNQMVWDGFMSTGTFIGGQYGIYARQPRTGIGSTELEADFNGQKASGIYITDAQSGSRTVISGSVFTNCYDGITLENNKSNSDLIIKNNLFTGVTRYGIDAFDNHGAKLWIGIDTTSNDTNHDALTGNSFVQSGIAAVYLHNNAYYDRLTNSGTQIHISHNEITSENTEASSGIRISEPTNGGRKYSALRVFDNSILNTCWGIVTHNAVGGNTEQPTFARVKGRPLPVSDFLDNKITNLSYLDENYTGITNFASSGLNFYGNDIKPVYVGGRNIRSFNVLQSPNTLMFGNKTSTGWGMMAQGNMLNSNYYCNEFTRAHEGIHMVSHILRGYRNDTAEHHGEIGTESRHNYYLSSPPSANNMHLNYTNNNYNYWVFQNSTLPVITISNAASPQPSIYVGNGANLCGVETSSHPNNPPGNEIAQMPDSPSCIETFSFDYYNQQQYAMGYQDTPTVSANMVALIEAENLAADGLHYTEALTAINTITPSSEPCSARQQIIADYKLLYQTYFAYKLLDSIPRNMDSAGIAIITSIAVKNGIENPAAFPARAILWDEKQLDVTGETFEPVLTVAGYLDAEDCTSQPLEANPVYLVDNTGQIVEGPVFTNANGEFDFGSSVVSAYENDLNTYSIRMILQDGSTIETAPATVSALARTSDHKLPCSTATPPFDISGLVHATGCPDMNPAGIMVSLLKDNDELVDGPLLLDNSGTFTFDPALAALHNNTGLYKIKLVFTDASTAETSSATIADLAANSVHEFNCPSEPPIILPKKSDSDKEPLNYKEWTNKQVEPLAFTVSPNPSNGIFRISGAGSQATATLKNLVGQVVLNHLPLTNGILDVSHLKAGVYILTVTNKHETYVRKITIRK